VAVVEELLLVVLLVVLRGREDCRAARAASSSRRLHCKQVKPSLVSHAVGKHARQHGAKHTPQPLSVFVLVSSQQPSTWCLLPPRFMQNMPEHKAGMSMHQSIALASVGGA